MGNLLLCSVPDRIDFAIVERLKKFDCSTVQALLGVLIAVKRSDFSL